MVIRLSIVGSIIHRAHRRLSIQALNEGMLARPPRGDRVEKEQFSRWLDYIDWEKSNPMGYEGSELGHLVKRVHYAYRQCLVVLRHHERIWIDVATCAPLQFIDEFVQQECSSN